MKDTIFISHATPEDNEFTIWLASRLELMGYKVWIDKKELLGGETFWKDIETSITVHSIKFLLVYSKNICYDGQKDQVKSGIQKEINFARSVVSDNPALKDFFIILHLDDSPFDLFPGAIDVNQIPFSSNWADGLTALLKKLQKDEAPKSSKRITSTAANWYLDHYLIKNPVIKKKELYFTNWWNTESLPEYYFILRFANEKQAQAVLEVNDKILLTRNANCIVSFKVDLNFVVPIETETSNVKPLEVFKIKISELLLGFGSESFPTQTDAENYFKKLLKRGLHNLLKKNGLRTYELSSKNLAYYHTPSSLPTLKVAFKYPFKNDGKTKRKNLFGKHLTIGKWHYAVSFKAVLQPFLGFKLASHIIFTSNGYRALKDPELQHSHRRKKGKRMFNEEWRDLLVAFINSLKDSNEKIEFMSNVEEKLTMKNMVEMFWSDFGYIDPKDAERQALFIDVDKDEEN
ncbi:toll/interleukin-1 receptor domain-containing protein [Dyadobacter sp. CY312]|uniref:toll/interleukin-1 receptor domain-containing protein n=1 Tax=Dyadobacter sp. CY312 TaxID=2907303 RepID=UPI001F217411|nr:toll/interleukin-1 receptor domain-containing protein [Dyadobacter sp. CY312]MCE7044395.1 toll/interleukin-1 receptor domain-containing protein [Dyadobacter sp. CY312]